MDPPISWTRKISYWTRGLKRDPSKTATSDDGITHKAPIVRNGELVEDLEVVWKGLRRSYLFCTSISGRLLVWRLNVRRFSWQDRSTAAPKDSIL